MSVRYEDAGRGFPVIDLPATGRTIERLRRAAGCSVRQLQLCLGFASPRAIYKWQRGEALPTLDNMVVLARVLGVHMEEILALAPESDREGRDNDANG